MKNEKIWFVKINGVTLKIDPEEVTKRAVSITTNPPNFWWLSDAQKRLLKIPGNEDV